MQGDLCHFALWFSSCRHADTEVFVGKGSQTLAASTRDSVARHPRGLWHSAGSSADFLCLTRDPFAQSGQRPAAHACRWFHLPGCNHRAVDAFATACACRPRACPASIHHTMSCCDHTMDLVIITSLHKTQDQVLVLCEQYCSCTHPPIRARLS